LDTQSEIYFGTVLSSCLEHVQVLYLVKQPW